MTTLAEVLLQEQQRVRELLELYVEIGPPGVFAASFIRQSLANAERAAASGDVVAMLQAYEDLKGYKE